MLLEHIGPGVGQMLSETWSRHQDDPTRRQNLFRGLARVMLSLARVPKPRIGSFRFHSDCTIGLTNRPLTCSIMILENEGTPRVMASDDTHDCTESFVGDMLTLELISSINQTPSWTTPIAGGKWRLRPYSEHFHTITSSGIAVALLLSFN